MAEPPKTTGPGCMIQGCLSYADTKIALTGSSLSEALIKATLIGSYKQHSHEGEPKDYNTNHSIHHIVCSGNLFITNQVLKVVKYHGVLYYTDYLCLIIAAER